MDSSHESDSNDDGHDTTTGKSADHSISNMRNAQTAAFDTWLLSSAGRSAVIERSHTKNKATDDEPSMNKLVVGEGAIIRSPRDYQLELFERAKYENTIAVLDTGSGKTLIAVLLMRWVIDQELERRETTQSRKVVFFLVNSVTLAHQQFAVLNQNLDHNVIRICGSDGPDSWDCKKWEDIFIKNDVIVCTADILLHCLARSLVSMRRTNLLVFDEAHHAKKDHPYARIIKDFYLAENDPTWRPKVFGMTASPVDARVDVERSATQLETLLSARIATTSSMTLAQTVNKPTETVLTYAPPSTNPIMTPLLQDSLARYGHIPTLAKHLRDAQEVCQELGGSCADIYLAKTLNDGNKLQLDMKIKKLYHSRTDEIGSEAQERDLAALQDAITFVQNHFIPVSPTNVTLSAKVETLRGFLGQEFERPTAKRCIIFVRQRRTSWLLHELFKSMATKFLHGGFLIGAGGDPVEGAHFSSRQQILTTIKFRSGEINCLFATPAAEEGLDVPECNLVVRLDLYNTMISYIQSRGRARSSNSRFIHMVENGNQEHLRRMMEVRGAEALMRRFCQTLPEDRKLSGNEDMLDALMENEKALKTYTNPKTGAKLTYGNALKILVSFLSTVENKSKALLDPTYVVTWSGTGFVAEVLIPEPAPIRSVVGDEHAKKSLAKRSAAFNACLELHSKGYIDGHFLSTFQKITPKVADENRAAGLEKEDTYSMHTKPTAWSAGIGSLPTELWVVVLDFSKPLEHEHQALAILTRNRLPELPQIPIYLNDGRQVNTFFQSFDQPLVLTELKLNELSKFTFKVFHDIFSKLYEYAPSKLSYWIAPVLFGTENNSSGSPTDRLDWNAINEAFEHTDYKWTSDMSHDFLKNRLLVDIWDGSRKFISVGVEPDMKPTDSVPTGTAKHKWNDNILDYSVSLYKNSRAQRVWDKTQPVVKAYKILTRRNFLAPADPEETSHSTLAYLCPEPLKISVLSSAAASSCFVLPAIIHRIESLLIAVEARDLVGVACDAETALVALTKDSHAGEQESERPIKLCSGMGDSYERLEWIGDTFLKLATTVAIFVQNPYDDECHSHVKRSNILCNQNLSKVANRLGLPKYIRSQSFHRRLWYPEHLKLLQGKGVNKEDESKNIKHNLGRKTLADVCEALIGAAFISKDKPQEKWQELHWDNAVRTVTKVVDNENHTMQTWNDYRLSYVKPMYLNTNTTASERDLARKVELEHSYKFRNPRLLHSAFVHPSQPFIYENVPSYQKLEHLGDALLDMACVTYLFHCFPASDEQKLTELKMAMASNRFLGALCVTIGFHRHLRHSHAELEHRIRAYAEELLEAREASGNARDFWLTVSDPPKCLPDIVESYIGAMFIDSDFDYNTVRCFFDEHIKWFFTDMNLYENFANQHPCTLLHKVLQNNFGCAEYRLFVRTVPSVDDIGQGQDVLAAVMLHCKIVAHAKGQSSRYTRRRAANKALEIIKDLLPDQFRTEFGCNCQLL